MEFFQNIGISCVNGDGTGAAKWFAVAYKDASNLSGVTIKTPLSTRGAGICLYSGPFFSEIETNIHPWREATAFDGLKTMMELAAHSTSKHKSA